MAKKEVEIIKEDNMKVTNCLLEQIRNILIVIAAILVVNVIVVGMSSDVNRNYTASTSGNNESGQQSEEQELPEYDVTAFKEVTVDEMFNEVAKSGYQVIYIGRSGCGYCRLFLEPLRKAQDTFKYKTLYIDLEKITVDGKNKLTAVSDSIKEGFGATPMLIIYKDGVYLDMRLGYSEYESLESYLIQKGMQK